MNIGDKIRAARINKNLTQEELGALLGIQKSAVAKYENGRVVNIKMGTLQKICEVLDMKASELIYETLESESELLSRYPLFKDKSSSELLASDGSAQLTKKEEYLIITIKDNSMADDRILPGDAVFIKKQFTVNNGELAAVSINNQEPIIRRFFYYPKEDKLVLSAGNRLAEPLVFLNDAINNVKIIGKAISFQSRII